MKMTSTYKNTAPVLLIFALIILCDGKQSDDSAELCQDPKDCEENTEGEAGGHKYEEKHQGKYLYPKEIDDKLDKIKIPQTFDEITTSMKKCGQRISTETITGETANNAAPSADADESMRQEARTSEDLQRMKRRLENWPENQPKGAIYLTVVPVAYRVNMLKGILRDVYAHFVAQFDYPVIIFHEPDFSTELQDEIRRTVPKLDLYFQLVKFRVPRWITEPMPTWACWHTHGIGYRHMCRFQSKLLMDQPILDGFTYVWRLDDDSHIHGPITFDLFAYMQERHLLFGYITQREDGCVCHLWESVRKYIEITKMEPKFFNEFPERTNYYNNFEISSLKLWRSLKYRHFIDFLDRLGGTYYYRWGDGPIKSIAVSLFVPKNQTHHFTSNQVKYKHQGYQNY